MSVLTQERLKQLLSYSPDTGMFTWNVRKGSCSAGTRAGGTPDKNNYFGIRIDGMAYYSHRLAFLYMLGEWPKNIVDHINGDMHDNRWRNLRDVLPAENQQNMKKASKASSTGLLGAFKCGRRFQSQIHAYGVHKHLGFFNTPEEAHAAYMEAKRRLHPEAIRA